MKTIEFITNSKEETMELAEKLASKLPSGITSVISIFQENIFMIPY